MQIAKRDAMLPIKRLVNDMLQIFLRQFAGDSAEGTRGVAQFR